ncbi:hypothetical protein OROGR_029375 [Orobanche gracilis]
MFSCSESPSTAVDIGGVGEIMLFGVRVKVDPMRKSVSMNNLSEYEPVYIDGVSNNNNNEAPKAATEYGGPSGYASADDAVPHPSNGSRERKRGIPWSEEEHKLFLIGLQKVGRGDWRGISRNYVKTRTPTQVASHAQKYFIRRNNLNRRRRRSSLFDITTDSVTPIPIEESKNHQDGRAEALTSNVNGFLVVPFPVNASPTLFSIQNSIPMEKSNRAQSDVSNDSSPMLVSPVPITPSTMVDLNLNQRVPIDPLQLSLKLSLSSGQDQALKRGSAFDTMRGLRNRDGVISVA